MKKYNSLKNMTPEEKRKYKLEQRNRIQKEYYQRHKDEIKAKMKGKYNYSRIHANRLERLRAYVKQLTAYPVLQEELNKIIDGKDIDERR